MRRRRKGQQSSPLEDYLVCHSFPSSSEQLAALAMMGLLPKGHHPAASTKLRTPPSCSHQSGHAAWSLLILVRVG